MKYLVMECHPGYAVVMDEKGSFYKTANMHYEVGQTVTQIVEVQTRRSRGRIQWLRSLAAAAACLVLFLSGIIYTGQQTYGSVYLTINPQVRIDVNRRDTVVGLVGINGDGETLLQGYHFQGKQLEQVMDELVDRAVTEGFLQDGGQVALHLSGKEQWIAEHTSSLELHLQHHVCSFTDMTVTVGACENTHRETESHHGGGHHKDTQTGACSEY